MHHPLATAAVTTLVVHSTTNIRRCSRYTPMMCVVPAVDNIFCAHVPNATATGVEELILCTAGFPPARLLQTKYVCSAGKKFRSKYTKIFVLSACIVLFNSCSENSQCPWTRTSCCSRDAPLMRVVPAVGKFVNFCVYRPTRQPPESSNVAFVQQAPRHCDHCTLLMCVVLVRV